MAVLSISWVGVFRVAPTVLCLFFPRLCGFFSDVRDSRLEARSGGLDAEEIYYLCIWDGIASVAYATVFGLIGIPVYHLLFEMLGVEGGQAFRNALGFIFAAFLATASVEVVEAFRVRFFGWFNKNIIPVRLIGPFPYLVLHLTAFGLIFWAFISWL